jgi:hypothetical protein
MKDKLYEWIMILLGCILVAIVAWLMISIDKSSRVDCDNLVRHTNGVNYEPLPEQCKKGER